MTNTIEVLNPQIFKVIDRLAPSTLVEKLYDQLRETLISIDVLPHLPRESEVYFFHLMKGSVTLHNRGLITKCSYFRKEKAVLGTA